MSGLLLRIVCLANSRKMTGRCVAGKQLSEDTEFRWIRPVSNREHEELSEEERRYEDGTDSKLLDIIDVPLLGHKPRTYQSENWLIDPEFYWSRVDSLDPDELPRLLDPPEPLWLNGFSTAEGFNDGIPLVRAEELQDSLRLIHVGWLKVSVFIPGQAFGKRRRRVQGRFDHAGIEYALWITDPVFERRFLAQPNGNYEVGDCFLTISLGEPFGGSCYKLIAAVIEPQQMLNA